MVVVLEHIEEKQKKIKCDFLLRMGKKSIKHPKEDTHTQKKKKKDFLLRMGIKA